MRRDVDKEIRLQNNKDRDRFYNKMSDEQKELFESIKNNIFTFCEATCGSGKAQPLYSKVLTPNGYITMGEVKVGTEVMGEDGKSHKVLGVFPQGKKPVYEITFSDGSKCRCSDEHLWTVKCYDSKKLKTLTLQDIINDGLRTSPFFCKKDGKYYTRHKYGIPVSLPMYFNSKEKLKLDPWLLGVLIGDGAFSSNNSIMFTNTEQDIIDKVLHKLKEYNATLSRKQNTDIDYGVVRISKNKNDVNHIAQIIRYYGLAKHKSEAKFIPKEYLYSNPISRLELLQGLIDTDGYVMGSQIFFYTSSKQLAKDVVFLVQSLGGTCSCNEHEAHYTYKGEKKRGLNNFELYIKMPETMLPFTSNKHLSRFKKPNTGVNRFFEDIKYIGEEECQCILVDNPSHLYITDNMIVTHNTLVSIAAMLDLLANGEINRIIYIQKTSQRFLQHGFYPGTVEEKTYELWTPFYDAMITLGHQVEEVDRMTKLGLIILTTDSSLRGVNFEKAGVILDESQNCDTETIRLIFTRCHDNCHIVMLGDVMQKDNKGNNNDFILYGSYLADSNIGNKCKLTKNFRGRFSQLAESYTGG